MDTRELMADAYRLSRDDLIVFKRLFMPVEDEEEKPPAWFHYEWCDILLNGKKHYAVEGFRESGKSSYVLRAFPIHCLVFPSKQRQYIVVIMSKQKA